MNVKHMLHRLHDRLEKPAASNALTLSLMSAGFVVTWIFILLRPLF